MLRQGEIYWVNLDPTRGSEIRKPRPCVIVSADVINEVRHTVIVLPLTTSAKPNPPIVVEVTCLDRQVTVVCDQIRAIDKSRLMNSAGCLSEDELSTLKESMRQILVLS